MAIAKTLFCMSQAMVDLMVGALFVGAIIYYTL